MATAHVTLDRHISKRESLLVIFGRPNVSTRIFYASCAAVTSFLSYLFLGGGSENSYLGSATEDSYLSSAAAGSTEILELKNETWNVVGQTKLERSLHAVSVIQYDDIQTSCDVPRMKDYQGKWKKNKDYIKF